MDRLYIDTNIFRDALEDRDSRTGRDLGTSALSVFSQSGACRFDIVVSTWTLEQLHEQIGPEPVTELLAPLQEQDKVIPQTYEDDDLDDARAVGGDWEDAVHGILAEKADADCVVTRNVRDFRLYTSLKAVLPENI